MMADRPRVRVRAGDLTGSSARIMANAATPEVETSHHAASWMAKDMASWAPSRISPDAALLPEMDTIGARIDDLARNNGIAAGAERTLVDNVIGPRVSCKPLPDRILINKPPEWVDDWSRQVESLFQSFTDTDWFDVALRYNFHVSTRLQMRMIASCGEALALPLWTQRNGSKWMTCLQLVDPARLSNPHGSMDTAMLRGGVELDSFGAPIAYHIRKTHPGDIFGFSTGAIGSGEWERIPAYQTWGRRRVLHMFESERVGQTRGKAIVTSVVRLFKMFDHYNREELRLAVLNSLIFAALETPLDQESIVGMFDTTSNPMEAYQAAINEWRIQMKGGAMIPLPPGTKMAPFTPSRPYNGLEQFSSIMLRSIGTGLNMPYELIFRDFSKTNYSSARAALLEAWRYFATVRSFVVDHWCWPIYDLWFEESVNKGLIPDCKPEDYYANQVAWTRAKWLFAGRGWVDPFKEARAAGERLRNGITTLSDEAGEQGHDWREQLEQLGREKTFAESLGLMWPPNQKATAMAASSDQEAVAAALEDAKALEEPA